MKARVEELIEFRDAAQGVYKATQNRGVGGELVELLDEFKRFEGLAAEYDVLQDFNEFVRRAERAEYLAKTYGFLMNRINFRIENITDWRRRR